METETASKNLDVGEIEGNFLLIVCHGSKVVTWNTVIGSFEKSRIRKIGINN